MDTILSYGLRPKQENQNLEDNLEFYLNKPFDTNGIPVAQP